MEIVSRIAKLTAAPGVSGMEEAVAQEIMAQFKACTPDVWQDVPGSVYARLGRGRPVVLIAAHMDEIGMLVTAIEENGMLRVCKIAGVDPRILPGARVLVHTAGGPLPAVMGALPPHLQTGKPKAYAWEDILCDTGLPAPEARRLVSVGDAITLYPDAPLRLLNERIAGKTLDDRAPLAALAQLAEALCAVELPCTAVLCATVQEERSGAGALAAGWGAGADMAIALDVTHAPPPEEKFRTFPLEAPVLTRGGSIHPRLFAVLAKAAASAGIPYATEACMTASGTDAWDIYTRRAGIPTALISVPLRYMHTGVELISLPTLCQTVRLLTEFLLHMPANWEDELCLPG
ncbi:MAG: M20/M25/M40 family metallo-hydrolase [Christensenellaceae bacterium]|jgi:endoglucanase|nr:M20/M25/M40 family metallo-hydrolase [Christensenellaceae bacterium]